MVCHHGGISDMHFWNTQKKKKKKAISFAADIMWICANWQGSRTHEIDIAENLHQGTCMQQTWEFKNSLNSGAIDSV